MTAHAWNEYRLPTSKQYWFEQGLKTVIIEGVDSETVLEIMKNESLMNLEEIREYSKIFPEIGPRIELEENRYEAKYQFL